MAKIRIGTSVQLSLVFLALACFLNYVGANRHISTKRECNECLAENYVVCRSAFDKSDGFCCETDDPFSEYCNTSPDNPYKMLYEVCTSDFNKRSASNHLICPISTKACGFCDPEFDPECTYKDQYLLDPLNFNSTMMSISNLFFRDGESCFFSIKADQELIQDDKLAYMVDLNITSLFGVKLHLVNGTSIEEAGNTIKTEFNQSSANFTYEARANNTIWIEFETDPDYEGFPTFLAHFNLRAVEMNELQQGYVEEFGHEPEVSFDYYVEEVLGITLLPEEEQVEGQASSAETNSTDTQDSNSTDTREANSTDKNSTESEQTVAILVEAEKEEEQVTEEELEAVILDQQRKIWLVEKLSSELTLSEMVIIYSILTCFGLVVLKNKLCPKSWLPKSKPLPPQEKNLDEDSTDIVQDSIHTMNNMSASEDKTPDHQFQDETLMQPIASISIEFDKIKGQQWQGADKPVKFGHQREAQISLMTRQSTQPQLINEANQFPTQTTQRPQGNRRSGNIDLKKAEAKRASKDKLRQRIEQLKQSNSEKQKLLELLRNWTVSQRQETQPIEERAPQNDRMKGEDKLVMPQISHYSMSVPDIEETFETQKD